MYLTLDLSGKCVGWATFSQDGKLIKKGRIIPSKEIKNFFKIHYIVERVRNLFNNVEDLVIEGIYLGTNPKVYAFLAMLIGAVADKWVEFKFKEPILYKATTARALAGVNGKAHKVEIQLFILDKYDFASKDVIKNYEAKVLECKKYFKTELDKLEASKDYQKLNKTNKKAEKKKVRNRYKYRMNKVSDELDKETGIGEDIADSIILGIAFQEEVSDESKN